MTDMPDEGASNTVRFLLILTPIYTDSGFTYLKPGTMIPQSAAPPEAAGWVEAGSARWILPGPALKAQVRATMVTALPGLTGQASGGEGTPENLVGRVPLTLERRQSHGGITSLQKAGSVGHL